MTDPTGTKHGSIADRFADVCRSTPDRIAIHSAKSSSTYGEALERAMATADHLLDRGVQSGDRVVLLCDQGPVAFAALMGVVGTGAIAVPLLPEHPVERLRQIVNDARPAVLAASSRHLQRAEAIAAPSVPIIELRESELATTRHSTWCTPRADQVALLMYTSGSTGTPKGVALTHQQLLHKMALNARLFGTTPDDRFALLGTYAVAQGMTAMLSALLYGATICTFDVRLHGVTALADWLSEARISVYISTLTLFRHLVGALDGPRRLEHVRLVRLGGERVAAQDVRAHRRHFGESSRLLISYSSTETGPITAHVAGPDDERGDGFVPVGRPVEGVTVIVADEAGLPVTDGEPGQIIVRSAFLSPGYWGDPERTAQTFRSVPGDISLREYRTGDEGRLENGVLHYLGRKQSRVKIRGYRVEIEEVELRLRACPGVARAAVAALPQADGALGLVGYVQASEGTCLTAEGLRNALQITLPDYAVPASFVTLPALPLTDSGKPDRARLPVPTREILLVDDAAVPPQTAAELTIADIWRQVLRTEVGTRDPFLSVGGDSLKAAQVASRLSRTFAVTVRVGEVLDASTVAGLAQLIERLRQTRKG